MTSASIEHDDPCPKCGQEMMPILICSYCKKEFRKFKFMLLKHGSLKDEVYCSETCTDNRLQEIEINE